MKENYNLHNLKKRIICFSIVFSLLLAVVVCRLGIIQLLGAENLQIKATDQWTRDLPLAAERGVICDTNGAELATSISNYAVYVRPREIKNKANVADVLSKKLNIDYIEIFEKISNAVVSEILIKNHIEKPVAIEIYKCGISGIYLAESIERNYTYGNLLTQVLGFTTIDNIGQAGLEQYYNQILCGISGSSQTQSDLQGTQLYNSLTNYIPSVSGCSIDLTIDVNIQKIVESTLEKLMIEQKAKTATGIVMNPKTGEILAMSTKPSFDLNNVPRDNIDLMLDMLKNQAIISVYEPGSTFKIVTMASCINSGHAHLSDKFYCPGYAIVDGQKIKCWKSTGHGSEDLTDGLCNSCNRVFCELALRMGTEEFYEYLHSFGFESETDIDFSGEASGIFIDAENVKNVDLARIGFGQSVAVTPIQLITAVSACVNGGYLMQPYLVKEITNANGEVVQNNNPITKRQVITNETSQIINNMLEETVSKPGKLTFVEGYEIGGKTGTSQKYGNGGIADGKYISSFIGTYPASNPEYVVLIVVDEPGTGAYFGSVVASPYAKEIFSGIFNLKNIKKADETLKLEYNIEMPYLVGNSLANATETLAKLGLNFEIQGDGGIVLGQLPPAGTMLCKGQSVYLIC